MIRIFVRPPRSAWQEIPNGPFPITAEQLAEAQRLYRAEWDATRDPLSGIHMSPQTTARDILKHVAPQLDDFDRGMIAFAVSNSRTRVEEA